MLSAATTMFYSVRSTPLLLAASSGGLSAVKGLIGIGADFRRLDSDGNGIVSLAAMRFHTNVLEYLIEWNHPDVPVWKILVGELLHINVGNKANKKLALKKPSKIAADNTFIFFLLLSFKKIRFDVSCDSHEMSGLIFSEKKKKKQRKNIQCCCSCDWHL